VLFPAAADREVSTVNGFPNANLTNPFKSARHFVFDFSAKRVKGIEPSSSAWKAIALPLSYTRNSTNISREILICEMRDRVTFKASSTVYFQSRSVFNLNLVRSSNPHFLGH
jgi:hypothetical protein